MFENLPDVLNYQAILDKAFRRAKKIEVSDKNIFYKKKKTILARIESFSNIIINELYSYVKNFPSIDDMQGFYKEILQIKVDINKLKKSLGAIDWAHKTCKKIYIEQRKLIFKSKDLNYLISKQKEIQGRISSVVKQVRKEIEVVKGAVDVLKQIPHIQNLPTVVIAGYPNVGKSSLLRCLSSAKPEIAQYPFTTKQIYVGHIEREERYIKKRFQIIDTPGLLDRPLEKRNKIERQAIAAIKHLADIVIFILDPSETCGYPLKDQKNLLSRLKKMFKKSTFIVVENKSDVKKISSKNLKISCKSKENIDILIDRIFDLYPVAKQSSLSS